MSQILALPTLSFPVTVNSNEVWADSWGYVDETGAPIAGTGIDLSFMLRLTPYDNDVLICASTIPGLLNGIPQNATIKWGGTGGNLIVPNVPVPVIAAIPVGGPYFGEVLGAADGYSRVLASIAFTVAKGIVR